ncbi:MAG TPA: FAD:protein FMN transferase [Nocardioidaceae bacterium]|nr:FAD:protein FMN transferase [Nocardioidaceae bacterium]
MAAHATRSWSVWSTQAYLGVDSPSRLTHATAIAEELVAAVDRTCARFRPDSDLSRVNASPGRWVRVDPLLVAAVRVALGAAAACDGLVDPCLGRSMVTWGYDADLAVLRRRSPVAVTPSAPSPGRWRDLGWEADALCLPAGCALDLGATAKAWTADLVAETVAAELGCGVVFSLGGDVRVQSDNGWPVSVSELPGDRSAEVVWLHEGGLATSTVLARRWLTTTGWAHHLLDPRTGGPVEGPVRTATAAGNTCVAANAASTAALVLGADAEHWLDSHGVTARLVLDDGSVRTVGDWPGEWRAASA